MGERSMTTAYLICTFDLVEVLEEETVPRFRGAGIYSDPSPTKDDLATKHFIVLKVDEESYDKACDHIMKMIADSPYLALGWLRQHITSNLWDRSGERIAQSERFVLFEVFEDGEPVGKVALSSKWSENDVMVELHSRGYPTGGRVKFEGWPSFSDFKLEILGDTLHRFKFSAI
jgi:hypothetical protein